MTAGSAFAPPAMKLSNRGLIRQMESWGWHVKKVRGETTEMVSPIGDKLTVKSGHVHTGNAAKTYQELLSLMNITWEQFMRPISEETEASAAVLRSVSSPEEFERLMQQALVAHAAEALEVEVAKELDASTERVRQRDQKSRTKRARREARATREDTTMSTQPTRATPARGRADLVFGVILTHSGPITNHQIAEALGIDVIKVGSSANYLHNELGVIDRVKRGVWQRKHEYSPHDMTFDVVSRNLDKMPEGLMVPAQMPTGEPKTVPVIHADRAFLVEDRDELLNDLLDLMFPDGFKAKHLRSIEKWKRATVALIDSIEEE